MGNRSSQPHDYLVNRPIPPLLHKPSEPIAEHYVWLYICMGVAGVFFLALLWYLCCHASPPTFDDEETGKSLQPKQRLLNPSHGQIGTKTSPVQPQVKSEFSPELNVSSLVKPGRPMSFGAYRSVPQSQSDSDVLGLQQSTLGLGLEEQKRKESLIFEHYGALNSTQRGSISMQVESLRNFNDYLYLASVNVPIEVDDDDNDNNDEMSPKIKKGQSVDPSKTNIFTIEKQVFKDGHLGDQGVPTSMNSDPSAPEIPREEQLNTYYYLTKTESLTQESKNPSNPK